MSCNATTYVERLVNLLDPSRNVFLNGTADDAEAALASGDPDRIRSLDGQAWKLT